MKRKIFDVTLNSIVEVDLEDRESLARYAYVIGYAAARKEVQREIELMKREVQRLRAYALIETTE